METDKLFRSASDYCHLGNRQGRSVGGENRLRFANRVERGEDLFLDRDVFGDGFDDELAFAQLLQRRGSGQVLQSLLFLLDGCLSSFDRPIQRCGDLRETSIQECPGHLADDGPITARGRDLCNAGTHQTGPHHSNFCYGHGSSQPAARFRLRAQPDSAKTGRRDRHRTGCPSPARPPGRQ